MICVVDASVFVASVRETEAGHAASLAFLKEIQDVTEESCCPTLILAECSAAITRRTGSAHAAASLVTIISNYPNLRLLPLDMPLAQHAAKLAAARRLRGADAVYAALAENQQATLVTWDTEVINRLDSHAAMTPEHWLKQREA